MKITVTLSGNKELARALRGYSSAFRPTSRETRVLFTRLGRAGRDMARGQISSRGGGTWDKLSKWTRAKTGRNKPLVTERGRIKYRVSPPKVEIGYEQRSSSWNLTKHHKGFTVPKSGRVTIGPLRRPDILKTKRKYLTITPQKDSVIPARNVWGTARKVRGFVSQISNKWALEIIRRKGRR